MSRHTGFRSPETWVSYVLNQDSSRAPGNGTGGTTLGAQPVVTALLGTWPSNSGIFRASDPRWFLLDVVLLRQIGNGLRRLDDRRPGARNVPGCAPAPRCCLSPPP